MKQIVYRGDHSAPYDHATGAGLVGKVFGPDNAGQSHRVTEAAYDEAADKTIATLQPMPDPYSFLHRAIAEAGQ